MHARRTAALCALAVLTYGCGGGESKPPQIKNNGTCTFSGASSTQGAHPCTVAGAFTTSEQVVLTSVSQIGTDPDIGTIYLPKGTLDATLVPITSASGDVRVQATF